MAEWILFGILSVVAITSALMMVLNRNPVHSALWLVLTFLCVAVFFLILGAQFLFAVQIIVYTGAIMVLFLFVVMLLNPEREHEMPSGGNERLGAVGLGVLLLLLIAGGVLQRAGLPAPSTAPAVTMRDVGLALYGQWLLPFELASILLLAAMVGAIVLTKRRA